MRARATIIMVLLAISMFISMPITYEQQREIITYTSTSETHIRGNKGYTVFYSSTMFTQEPDGNWYSLSQVSNVAWQSGGFNFSYRRYWVLIEPFVVYNGHVVTIQEIKNAFPNVNIRDYVTPMRFNHKFALNYSNVPQQLVDNVDYLGFRLKESHGLTWDDVERKQNSVVIKNKIEISYADLLESNYTLNLLNRTHLLIGNIAENYENGTIFLDPSIILQDADSENFEDTSVTNYNPSTNYGNQQYFEMARCGSGGNVHYRTLAKFNITEIPPTSTIDEATFNAYLYYNKLDLASEGYWIGLHHHYNLTWIETYPTWNNVGSLGSYNATRESTFRFYGGSGEPSGWISWSCRYTVEKEYQATNTNVTVYMIGYGMFGSPSLSDECEFRSKEYGASPSLRPYLNVTYSGMNYPQYSNVGATPHYADETCNFYANWSDVEGLSGYIFGTNNTGSWNNDTWSSFGGATWSNVSKTLIAQIDVRLEWCIWANDTNDGWNNTGTQWFLTIGMNITFYRTAGGLFRQNCTNRANGTMIEFVNKTVLELCALTMNASYRFLNFTSIDVGNNSTSNPHNYTIVGDANITIYFEWITAIPPTYEPQIILVGLNSTVNGTAVLFNFNLSDNTGLDYYIFGWNNSGAWANDTAIDISGTSYIASVIKSPINQTLGCAVQYQLWCNDTEGNWGTSELHFFIVNELGYNFINAWIFAGFAFILMVVAIALVMVYRRKS